MSLSIYIDLSVLTSISKGYRLTYKLPSNWFVESDNLLVTNSHLLNLPGGNNGGGICLSSAPGGSRVKSGGPTCGSSGGGRPSLSLSESLSRAPGRFRALNLRKKKRFN